eukprot:10052-Heterococcus_DN1.PRE.2
MQAMPQAHDGGDGSAEEIAALEAAALEGLAIFGTRMHADPSELKLPSASLELQPAEGDTNTAASALDVPAVMAPCASVGETVSTIKNSVTQQNGKARSKPRAAPAKKGGKQVVLHFLCILKDHVAARGVFRNATAFGTARKSSHQPPKPTTKAAAAPKHTTKPSARATAMDIDDADEQTTASGNATSNTTAATAADTTTTTAAAAAGAAAVPATSSTDAIADAKSSADGTTATTTAAPLTAAQQQVAEQNRREAEQRAIAAAETARLEQIAADEAFAAELQRNERRYEPRRERTRAIDRIQTLAVDETVQTLQDEESSSEESSSDEEPADNASVTTTPKTAAASASSSKASSRSTSSSKQKSAVKRSSKSSSSTGTQKRKRSSSKAPAVSDSDAADDANDGNDSTDQKPDITANVELPAKFAGLQPAKFRQYPVTTPTAREHFPGIDISDELVEELLIAHKDYPQVVYREGYRAVQHAV